MGRVYWTFLKERHGAAYADAFDSFARIMEYTARLPGFVYMHTRPLPVAHARNAACQAFMEQDRYPHADDDTLVMLDADHVMQPDIVEKLGAHDKGVVGALATSRGEVPFICFFGKGTDGNLYNMSEWDDGELAEGVVVGSGAIAIKRWVFQKLEHCAPSWFRYLYGGYKFESTEEMYFGYECAKAGIPHYCDTSLWIPHCTVAYTTPAEWREWFRDNPQVRSQVAVPEEYKGTFKAAPRAENFLTDTTPEQEKGDGKWKPITAALRKI